MKGKESKKMKIVKLKREMQTKIWDILKKYIQIQYKPY